jgi:hypothetical protein
MKQNNTKIGMIITDINQRKLPKLVFQDISLSKDNINIDDIMKQFEPDSYIVIMYKVGYVGGKTNPLNHITFYDSKTQKVIENKVKDFSLLINQKF